MYNFVGALFLNVKGKRECARFSCRSDRLGVSLVGRIAGRVDEEKAR